MSQVPFMDFDYNIRTSLFHNASFPEQFFVDVFSSIFTFRNKNF